MMAACGATRAILESQFMVDLFVMMLKQNPFGRSFPLCGPAWLLPHERLANPMFVP